jgi:hypothetical protein
MVRALATLHGIQHFRHCCYMCRTLMPLIALNRSTQIGRQHRPARRRSGVRSCYQEAQLSMVSHGM